MVALEPTIVLSSLLSAGDHVICMYPTYEQLYQTPRAMRADVTLWRLDVNTGRQVDLEFLESVVKTNTKMIILNSPNNPTELLSSAECKATSLRSLGNMAST